MHLFHVIIQLIINYYLFKSFILLLFEAYMYSMHILTPQNQKKIDWGKLSFMAKDK